MGYKKYFNTFSQKLSKINGDRITYSSPDLWKKCFLMPNDGKRCRTMR